MYDESTGCPLCQSGAQRIGPFYLWTSRIPKASDFAQTIASEIVVSRRLANLFTENHVTGAALEPVHTRQGVSSEWFHFSTESSQAEIVSPTVVGIKPFNLDPEGEHRCPIGDLIGLTLLSELSISEASCGEADTFLSANFRPMSCGESGNCGGYGTYFLHLTYKNGPRSGASAIPPRPQKGMKM